ncbi:peptide chain release factor N(5)-glutamine methyltransferase [candidate division WOR-3 bacterium]|nr:peptide chain release factor N(5)-glutamine methyltransferase [candidate division WOR-3 bacterium]
MKTISELLENGSVKLENSGVEPPFDEAVFLLSKVLKTKPDILLERKNTFVKPENIILYCEYIEKRAKRIPRQYIAGEDNFMGLRILLGPGVFIPRPETELLAQKAETILRNRKGKVIDCFSGSGILSLYLASRLPEIDVISVEKSQDAIDWQKKNISLYADCSGRISIIRTDILLSFKKNESLIAIIANPPYIPSQSIADLDPEVRMHEPREALDGGENGLDVFGRFVRQSSEILPKGSFLISEIGFGQYNQAYGILKGSGFNSINFEKDLSGIKRMVIAQK